MEIKSIKTPIIKPGDDLIRILLDSMKSQKMSLKPGDIVIAGEKVVATAQGRIVDIATIAEKDVPDQARRIGEKYNIDPRKVKVIMDESEEILGGVDTVLLTKSYGLLLANAGIDSSNAGRSTNVILFPADLWGTTRQLRAALEKASGVKPLGFMIIDSRVQPLKVGVIGNALAVSGFQPVEDIRGQKDIFGRVLLIKQIAVADDLSSAAEIMMREAAEQTPFVLVHDAPVKLVSDDQIKEDALIMPMDECLFMHVFKNYTKDKILLTK